MDIKNWKSEWGQPRDNKIPTQVQTPPSKRTGNCPSGPKSPSGFLCIGEVPSRDISKEVKLMRLNIKKAQRARNKQLKLENRRLK